VLGEEGKEERDAGHEVADDREGRIVRICMHSCMYMYIYLCERACE
jgi:hypothetical protein